MSKPTIKALKFTSIKIDDIILSSKKNNKKVQIKYGNDILVFQTPFMEVKKEPRTTLYPDIVKIDTFFKGESKSKIQKWFHFIENLENHIVQQVEQYGSTWFTQKNVIIKSLIRELEPHKIENDDIDTSMFFIEWPVDIKGANFIDEHKKPFDFSNLKEGDLVKFIIEISNLWIDKNQFGLIFIIKKVMVKSHKEKIKKVYDFDEDSDSGAEDDENIISLFATEQKNKKSSLTNKIDKNSQISFPSNKITNHSAFNKLSKNNNDFYVQNDHISHKKPNHSKINISDIDDFQENSTNNKSSQNIQKDYVQKNLRDIPSDSRSVNQKGKIQMLDEKEIDFSPNDIQSDYLQIKSKSSKILEGSSLSSNESDIDSEGFGIY